MKICLQILPVFCVGLLSWESGCCIEEAGPWLPLCQADSKLVLSGMRMEGQSCSTAVGS